MIRIGLLLVGVLLAAGSFGRKVPESKAKIVYVDAKNAFIAIDKGPKDGIHAGTEFDIVREVNGVFQFLGKGVCEKFLGQNTMAKIVITSGEVREMLVGDGALYDARP